MSRHDADQMVLDGVQIAYTDGSANVTRIKRVDGHISWRYEPVSRQQSSSGFYSGGEAAEGRMSFEAFDTIWEKMSALLDAEGKEPDGSLRMGVGWFHIRIKEDKRSFMVESSKALHEFEVALKAACI